MIENSFLFFFLVKIWSSCCKLISYLYNEYFNVVHMPTPKILCTRYPKVFCFCSFKKIKLLRRVDCIIFSHVKKGRERSRNTLEKIVKRDPVVNNILENLVFN